MKIDTSKIENYDSMTAEEKLAALEAYDIPDPDYTGYVKKELFDKKASELAAKTKELNSHLSDEEVKSKEREAADKKLREDYDALLHESQVSKAKAKFLGLKYDENTANEAAEALVSGDTEKLFSIQQKAQTAFEKSIRSDALKNSPKGNDVGGGSDNEEGSLGVKYAKQYNSMYTKEE